MFCIWWFDCSSFSLESRKHIELVCIRIYYISVYMNMEFFVTLCFSVVSVKEPVSLRLMVVLVFSRVFNVVYFENKPAW